MTHFRVRAQLDEALGSDNRWYCSQIYGQCINDPDRLIEHFVKSGGAKDFAARYTEAMGELNRYYCSQRYGRDIRDERTLWIHYMSSRQTAAARAMSEDAVNV